VTVADNGPGFDDDTLSHLFEPYVTTKARGTVLRNRVCRLRSPLNRSESGEM